jgi:tetratricopeptide (TPR) repeat protein
MSINFRDKNMKLTLKEAQKLRTFLPNYYLDKMVNVILAGHKYIDINDCDYQMALVEYKEYRGDQKALSHCAALNNKGIALEKEGKIKAAIKIYEKNIETRYPAHHSYKRLMVLYRKNRDYENEIRVIDIALDVFGNCPEYIQRLDKAQQLEIKRNHQK